MSREPSSSEISSSNGVGDPGLIKSSSSSSSTGDLGSPSEREDGIPVVPNWCNLEQKKIKNYYY